MKQRNEKKKLPIGQIIGLLAILLAADVEVLSWIIVLAIIFVPIGLVGYLIFRITKKNRGSAAPRRAKQETFDDCPKQLFCFHKDKGEHHVRRGREVDPWDRPDIDISRYQRRQSK